MLHKKVKPCRRAQNNAREGKIMAKMQIYPAFTRNNARTCQNSQFFSEKIGRAELKLNHYHSLSTKMNMKCSMVLLMQTLNIANSRTDQTQFKLSYYVSYSFGKFLLGSYIRQTFRHRSPLSFFSFFSKLKKRKKKEISIKSVKIFEVCKIEKKIFFLYPHKKNIAMLVFITLC